MKKISIRVDKNEVNLDGIGSISNNIPQIHIGMSLDSNVHILKIFGDDHKQIFLHVFKDVKINDGYKVIVNHNTSGKMESVVGFCSESDADYIANCPDLVLNIN